MQNDPNREFDRIQSSAFGEGYDAMTGEAQGARAKAEQLAAEAKGKLHHVADKVNERADAAMTAVGSTMDSVAGSLRGSTPTIAGAAERTAQSLESAASYLKNTDAKHLLSDVGEVVKRHPVPVMLGAAAVGFALARRMRA